MKRPTAASQKRVTVDNLEGLGASRLGQILFDVAQGRPDLKRRLRMELAAHQGAEALALEIDKRLNALATSRSKIGWRQRPAFGRDLDALRLLIADRLAGLDRQAGLERLWRLMRAGSATLRRLTDKDGAVADIFGRVAEDLGRLMGEDDAPSAAETFVSTILEAPAGWAGWLARLLSSAPPAFAPQALEILGERRAMISGGITIPRQLASAAGNIEAYAATFTVEARTTPAVAADLAARYLALGRQTEAGALLRAAAPKPQGRQGRLPAPDFSWETAWIDYLDQTGEAEAARAVRWASFERTLSAERLRAFTSRLADFDDVEAEGRAFDYAARHPDFEAGLRLLVAWPALAEAAAMILARRKDISANPEDAELWAGKLRGRHPAAAHQLLCKAAAAAFRRREFKVCDRLSAEADAIALPARSVE